jgi:hypothetical protein
LEKKLLKKSKMGTKIKAPGTAQEDLAPGPKVTKGRAQASTSGNNKERGSNAADGVASQAKKRPHK